MGGVDGRGASVERNSRRGEPHRSLEGLDCLGMLLATPADMRTAWRGSRRQSPGNRRCVATAFQKKSPTEGAHGVQLAALGSAPERAATR